MLPTMIIKADGKVFTVTPANKKTFQLKELQEAVKGFVEIIRLDRHRAIMVINEEGKLIDLPVNETATDLFQEQYGHGDYIVGDVLIAQYEQIE